MTIRDIAGVRVRLEESVAGLPGEPADAEDVFSRLEMVCIQVLDSESEQYLPGHLQRLLMSYLHVREIELGLLPDIDTKEE
jgi:hypothetical protein